jgi:hypothetical protein
MAPERACLPSRKAVGNRAAGGWRVAVGEEAEVANAHEAAWQQVEQEAAQELFHRQGDEPLLVAVSGVAPAKGYVALGESSVQTTEIYTRADPTVRLETLEAAIAPKLRTGRFKATDKLIALLQAPTIMRSKGAIP